MAKWKPTQRGGLQHQADQHLQNTGGCLSVRNICRKQRKRLATATLQGCIWTSCCDPKWPVPFRSTPCLRHLAPDVSGDGVRSLPVVKSSKGASSRDSEQTRKLGCALPDWPGGKSGKGGKRSTSGAKHKGPLHDCRKAAFRTWQPGKKAWLQLHTFFFHAQAPTLPC